MNVLQTIRQYLILIRFNRPSGTMYLFLPCLIGMFLGMKNGKNEYLMFFNTFCIMFFGAFLLRSMGCIINDIIDKDIDAKVARTSKRPIASGVISVKSAIVFFLMLSVPALVIFAKLTTCAKIAAIVQIPLIIVYPFTKRFFPLPQLFLSLTYNSGIFIAFYSITNSISMDVFVFYFVLICYTMIYDTVYSIQDMKDDLTIGIKSSAITFGSFKFYIVYFLSIAICLVLIAYGITNFLSYIYYALCFCGVLSLVLLTAFSQVSSNPNRYDVAFKGYAFFGLFVSVALFMSFY